LFFPEIHGIIKGMKSRDLDKERSEKLVSLAVFLSEYNETIPAGFPRASVALLNEFKSANAILFKHKNSWSLDQHRKKVMDWLPRRVALA
jgi:hypothetical protein